MTKADIRAQIAKQKKSFRNLETLSASVVQKFHTFEIFRTARAVGAYMPLPDEVDITPLFQSLDKTFFIPAFDEVSGSYRMARLTTELKKGHFGIPEPAVPAFAAEDALDIIIVPGVAFDRAGRRIGRGSGFYDRLLPQYSAVRTGVCFGFQYLESIPAEEHDVRMDFMVTESLIFKVCDEH